MTQMPQGHPHPQKMEVEKRAITLIIIGRFYPNSNLTIFYDYIPRYKIGIQYTNQSFFQENVGRKTSFEGGKGP